MALFLCSEDKNIFMNKMIISIFLAGLLSSLGCSNENESDAEEIQNTNATYPNDSIVDPVLVDTMYDSSSRDSLDRH